MGLFSSIGDIINDLTGASNSANQSYQYNSALQTQNWEHQKEAMQNQVQWRAQDLEKAGYNPALAAGGSGANTGGAGGGGGGVNAPMGDLSGLLNVIATFKDLTNRTKVTNAQSGLLDAQTIEQISKNKYIEPQIKTAIMNTIADTKLKEEQQKNTAEDAKLKGQMRATSAMDEKVKKEQIFLNRAYTTESAGRTAQIRQGKISNMLGTEYGGQLLDLLKKVGVTGKNAETIINKIWEMVK